MFDKNSKDIFSSNLPKHQIDNIFIDYNAKLQVSTLSGIEAIENLKKNNVQFFVYGKFQNITLFFHSQNLGDKIILRSQKIIFLYTSVNFDGDVQSNFGDTRFEIKKRPKTNRKQLIPINEFSEENLV